MPLSGQKDLDEVIKQWVKWDHNADTLNQIMEAVENKNWKVYVLSTPTSYISPVLMTAWNA